MELIAIVITRKLHSDIIDTSLCFLQRPLIIPSQVKRKTALAARAVYKKQTRVQHSIKVLMIVKHWSLFVDQGYCYRWYEHAMPCTDREIHRSIYFVMQSLITASFVTIDYKTKHLALAMIKNPYRLGIKV
jgi:hypothetical protein